MLKLWDRNNRLVQQESGMFAGKDEIQLLFPAEKIIRVQTPATGMEFFEGQDFTFIPEKNCLRRLPGSRIPALSPEDLRPGADVPLYPAPGARAVKGAVDGGFLIFDASSFFAENQVEIDYRAKEIDFDPELSDQSDRLPEFRKKLAEKAADIRITLIGDSISAGFNATAFTGSEPFAPAYIDQVVRHLDDRFQVDITRFNHAVDGTGTLYALQNSQLWVNDRPDLLIIAYGMNEFGRKNAEDFKNNNLRLIDMIREYSPDCEVILVNSMTGNPQWTPTVPGADAEYAEIIRQLVADSDSSIALADVQKVWKKILARKDFYDLTGNGVNHPNDYGHRIYASVLNQLLCQTPFF